MKAVIIPKLGLRNFTDTEFDLYVAERIISVPVVFPVTNPSISSVAAKHTYYHQSVVGWIRGIKASTALKRQLRRELHVLVTNFARNCAILAGEDIAAYLLTGFDHRQKGSILSPPPAPANFKLTAADDEQLMATFDKVRNNHGYMVVLSTEPDFSNEKSLQFFPASNGELLIAGLISGTRYYGRARATGARNKPGEWSDISGKICP